MKKILDNFIRTLTGEAFELLDDVARKGLRDALEKSVDDIEGGFNKWFERNADNLDQTARNYFESNVFKVRLAAHPHYIKFYEGLDKLILGSERHITDEMEELAQQLDSAAGITKKELDDVRAIADEMWKLREQKIVEMEAQGWSPDDAAAELSRITRERAGLPPEADAAATAGARATDDAGTAGGKSGDDAGKAGSGDEGTSTAAESEPVEFPKTENGKPSPVAAEAAEEMGAAAGNAYRRNPIRAAGSGIATIWNHSIGWPINRFMAHYFPPEIIPNGIRFLRDTFTNYLGRGLSHIRSADHKISGLFRRVDANSKTTSTARLLLDIDPSVGVKRMNSRSGTDLTGALNDVGTKLKSAQDDIADSANKLADDMETAAREIEEAVAKVDTAKAAKEEARTFAVRGSDCITVANDVRTGGKAVSYADIESFLKGQDEAIQDTVMSKQIREALENVEAIKTKSLSEADQRTQVADVLSNLKGKFDSRVESAGADVEGAADQARIVIERHKNALAAHEGVGEVVGGLKEVTGILQENIAKIERNLDDIEAPPPKKVGDRLVGGTINGIMAAREARPHLEAISEFAGSVARTADVLEDGISIDGLQPGFTEAMSKGGNATQLIADLRSRAQSVRSIADSGADDAPASVIGDSLDELASATTHLDDMKTGVEQYTTLTNDHGGADLLGKASTRYQMTQGVGIVERPVTAADRKAYTELLKEGALELPVTTQRVTYDEFQSMLKNGDIQKLVRDGVMTPEEVEKARHYFANTPNAKSDGSVIVPYRFTRNEMMNWKPGEDAFDYDLSNRGNLGRTLKTDDEKFLQYNIVNDNLEQALANANALLKPDENGLQDINRFMESLKWAALSYARDPATGRAITDRREIFNKFAKAIEERSVARETAIANGADPKNLPDYFTPEISKLVSDHTGFLHSMGANTFRDGWAGVWNRYRNVRFAGDYNNELAWTRSGSDAKAMQKQLSPEEYQEYLKKSSMERDLAEKWKRDWGPDGRQGVRFAGIPRLFKHSLPETIKGLPFKNSHFENWGLTRHTLLVDIGLARVAPAVAVAFGIEKASEYAANNYGWEWARGFDDKNGIELDPMRNLTRLGVGMVDFVLDDVGGVIHGVALAAWPGGQGFSDGTGVDIGGFYDEMYEKLMGEKTGWDFWMGDAEPVENTDEAKRAAGENLTMAEEQVAKVKLHFTEMQAVFTEYEAKTLKTLDDAITAAGGDAEKIKVYEALKQNVNDSLKEIRDTLGDDIRQVDALLTPIQDLKTQIDAETDLDAARALLEKQQEEFNRLNLAAAHISSQRPAQATWVMGELNKAIANGTALDKAPGFAEALAAAEAASIAAGRTPDPAADPAAGTTPDPATVAGAGTPDPAAVAGTGTPAPATGTPAPATGTPAPATGTPAPTTGTPAPAAGTPAPAAAAPAQPTFTGPLAEEHRRAHELLQNANTQAAQISRLYGPASIEGSAAFLIAGMNGGITDFIKISEDLTSKGKHNEAGQINALLADLRGNARAAENSMPALKQNEEEARLLREEVQKLQEKIAAITANADKGEAQRLLGQLDGKVILLERLKEESATLVAQMRELDDGGKAMVEGNSTAKYYTSGMARFQGGLVEYGGEYGLLNQWIGGGGPGKQSAISGLFNTVTGALEAGMEKWDWMKKNAKTQKERNILNAVETGATIIGGMVVWNMLKRLTSVFGINIPKGVSIMAVIGIVAFALYRSGVIGQDMADAAKSFRPFAQTNSGAHIPTGTRTASAESGETGGRLIPFRDRNGNPATTGFSGSALAATTQPQSGGMATNADDIQISLAQNQGNGGNVPADGASRLRLVDNSDQSVLEERLAELRSDKTGASYGLVG